MWTCWLGILRLSLNCTYHGFWRKSSEEYIFSVTINWSCSRNYIRYGVNLYMFIDLYDKFHNLVVLDYIYRFYSYCRTVDFLPLLRITVPVKNRNYIKSFGIVIPTYPKSYIFKLCYLGTTILLWYFSVRSFLTVLLKFTKIKYMICLVKVIKK